MKRARTERWTSCRPIDLFHVVADIAAYPSFIPFCESASVTQRYRVTNDNPASPILANKRNAFLEEPKPDRVVPQESRISQESGQEILIASMTGRFFGVRVSYHSRVLLDLNARVITAEALDGPFEVLRTNWRFAPLPHRGKEGTCVFVEVTFSFARSMLNLIVTERALKAFANQNADAFIKRVSTFSDSSLTDP